MRPAGVPSGDAGFTLIELLVALALFALISVAGVSLMETVIGVQGRTAGRAARLAELQRGLYAASADFEALTTGPDREGDRITLTRSSRDGDYQVAYVAREGALHRVANGLDRVLIGHIAAARWRFFKDGAWTDQPVSKDSPARPAGVEVVLDLGPVGGIGGGLGGSVRRVIELPGEAELP